MPKVNAQSYRRIIYLTPMRSESWKPVFFVVFTVNQFIDHHIDASNARSSDLCRVMRYHYSPSSSPLMHCFAGSICQEISTEWPGFYCRSYSFADFIHNQSIESVLFRFPQLPVPIPRELLWHAVIRECQRPAACIRSSPSCASSCWPAFGLPDCAFVVDFAAIFCFPSYSTCGAQ